MAMEFSPFNPTIKLCLQGMEMEDLAKPDEAIKMFIQAWNEAKNESEKFLAAHYIARLQGSVSDRLKWLEKALQLALIINDDSIQSALPSLYLKLSDCYAQLGQNDKAEENAAQSKMHQLHPSDKGPFYYGTKANLEIGDMLTSGGSSNYKTGLTMKHIYFTALKNGAGLAAALAKGDGQERVYIVEPSGIYENDPNLTDKKFPGNPSRSYRSQYPLKIVGELLDWIKPTPEDLDRFRKKLEESKGEIIN